MRTSAAPGSPLACARIAAHAAFDPKWQGGGSSRSQAYKWLAEQLGIPKHECHMVMFDIETCERVIVLCKAHGLKPRSVTDDFEVLP